MKRYLFILMITALGLFSCSNFDREFNDFEYTSAYFPYQFPVRVLVLGDYIYDNANDNAHKFLISAAMGGVYRNDRDRILNIKIDESLCKGVSFSNGDPIKPLPSSYYKLSNENNILIPKGKFNGSIEVQLTDKFFEDPESIKNTYVVPIYLLYTNDVDSVLCGKSSNPNADPRIISDWDKAAPKDFTMFGIKFINEWHGNYFHYGSSTLIDTDGGVLEQYAYREKFVESNSVYKLKTTARHQVSLTHTIESSLIVNTNVTIVFDFDGDNCTLSAPDGASYSITGSGTFKKNAYQWGNKSRNGIEYSMTLTLPDGKIYKANDTLVARDRAVVMEVYSPILK